jgi:DnaJ-class molecular chaperone
VPGGRVGLGSREREAAQPRDFEQELRLTLEEIDQGTKRTLTYQTLDAVQTRDGGISSVPTNKRVEVTIPAGITDGKKLRIPGRGATGLNGKSGDLYVVIRWNPHKEFSLRGDALEVEAGADYLIAVIGGEISVPTLRGSLKMKVPPGSQSGQIFRLGGQGIQKLNGARGDLLARLKITVPKSLTPEQRALLIKLQELEAKS